MLPKTRHDPYQQVWEAFQQSRSTDDGRHDTPHWRAHDGPFAACVIRVPDQVLKPALTVLRDDLAGVQGARIHPDHFLHIMLQELGFMADHPGRPDEITQARVEEFAFAATTPLSSIAPFTVALGGANSFQDAVFLEIDRGELLNQIHERLFDLAAVPHVPAYPYLAHCTIAHYDGSVSPREARSVLETWRANILGQFTVTEIEIVTIDPGETYPELQNYAVIPLAT